MQHVSHTRQAMRPATRGDAALARQIGARVRDRRQALGMTPDALARSAGITRAVLEQQEDGQARLPAEALLALAEALGVPLRHLFDAQPVARHDRPLAPREDGEMRALAEAYARIRCPDMRRVAVRCMDALAGT